MYKKFKVNVALNSTNSKTETIMGIYLVLKPKGRIPQKIELI